MNQRAVFQLSAESRRADARKAAADAAKRTVAKKSATADAALSEEELALAAQMAEDPDASWAKLYLNGVLVRVGFEWIGDGQELWEASLQ